MPYDNNATITTRLSQCDQIVNITQTIQDLYNLYQNNGSYLVSSTFLNVSIINVNCIVPNGKYFQQIITFTRSVSIHIQIAFASVYYDLINTNAFVLNGFYIDQEQEFNLSSITLNNSAQSKACSSASVAQDPLCLLNSTTPDCINIFPNPWIFNCSDNANTSTVSSFTTTNDNAFLSATTSSILSSWQIGLICGLSVLFLLILLLFIGCLLRRHSRSKRITFSCENLFDDMKSFRNNGIPQVQAFQRTATIAQRTQTNNPFILSIHNGNRTYTNHKTYIHRKLLGTYNRGTFIDHAKIHDPVFPSNIPENPIKPNYIPNNHVNTVIPKGYHTTIISRPVSGTSISQLKSITDGLEEDTLDESDSISLDRFNSITPTKPSTPVSRQLTLVDESLHDEDAWMSILAVANAELDVLNRLENEQNSIQTSM